jgi:fucose permease
LLLLHAAFVLTGTVTTLLGPILPILAGWWALDDWQAGLLFTLQFLGSMLGVAGSSVGMTRLGFRPTLVIGLALMAAGVAPLGTGTPGLGFASVFCYGVGLGLTIPTTNLTVAEWQPSRRASALNVLNLAWGIGAVSSPPIIALFHAAHRTHVFLFALAGALALMALTLARMRLPAVDRVPLDDPRVSASGAVPWWHPSVLVFGALLFVYVGTETALAGWVAVYGQRLEIVPVTLSLAAPSFFWAALLLGRAVAPFLLRWVAEGRLLAWSLILASAGVAVLLAATSAGVLVLAVSLGGLGLATVFPTTLALFTREFGRAAARLAGPVFALAGLGGASLPPLVGIISTQFESLKVGLGVPLLGCLAMLMLLRPLGRIAILNPSSLIPNRSSHP